MAMVPETVHIDYVYDTYYCRQQKILNKVRIIIQTKREKLSFWKRGIK